MSSHAIKFNKIINCLTNEFIEQRFTTLNIHETQF